MSLEKSAEKIINYCMGVKKAEKVLVIADKNKEKIGKALLEQAKKITNAKLIEVPVGKVNGEEPPSYIADEMKRFDVILIATTVSMSHTKARREASEAGARIASMPGITEDMMERAIDVDYDAMAERGHKIRDALKRGKMVRITTKIGTDIKMSVENREAKGGKGGVIHKKGDWDNLPVGEACTTPVEGTANGIFIVDASFGGIGKLSKPIKITVKDGFAVKIEDGEEAKKLKKILEDIHDKNAFNIAELGIGTNDKAKITGNVLEDEKVIGTCHIALGNSKSLGGKVDVPVHLDGVINKPTIFIDGKKIISEGRILI
jgi:leucyl aminopeptidase (aminopeptidase T)